MTRPVLSVLVPAYNDRAGLISIINSIPDRAHEMEVIIHDDSPVPLLNPNAPELLRKRSGAIRYRHNEIRSGAPANWNSLLLEARGTYICVMHHDEVPLDASYWTTLLALLRNQQSRNLYISACIVKRGHETRRHATRLSQRIAARFPSLLYVYNCIGPSGCITLRRAMAVAFDEDLSWYVDVHWYRRCIDLANGSIGFFELAILSDVKSTSITNSIADRLRGIKQRELRYLNEGRWLSLRMYLLLYPVGRLLRIVDKIWAWRGIW